MVSRSGLSLIEIVVAIAVLAVVTIPLVSMGSGGAFEVDDLVGRTRASELTDGILAFFAETRAGRQWLAAGPVENGVHVITNPLDVMPTELVGASLLGWATRSEAQMVLRGEREPRREDGTRLVGTWRVQCEVRWRNRLRKDRALRRVVITGG